MLDEMTPQQHRARYEALKAAARGKAAAPVHAQAQADAMTADRIRHSETIPPGWYHAVALRRGQALRLLNVAGTPGVAAMIWNAKDPSERFNAGDTVKLQWTARLVRGRVLFSDMGRVLMAIIADTCGRHDALVGGAALPAGGRSSRDNLRLAAAKHGLDRRDLAPCVTFFAPVSVGEDGALGWEDAVRPGQYVDLRAEMDLLVALSNCPHPLAPTREATGAVTATVWQPPPAAPDDECRHFGEEAERGYENTDAFA